MIGPRDVVAYVDYTYTKRLATVLLIWPGRVGYCKVLTDKGQRRMKRFEDLQLIKKAA